MINNIDNSYPSDKKDMYRLLASQMKVLLEGETNTIANLANASALLNDALENINWVGFYLMNNGELVLGLFRER